ncbi:MAG: hypothetical protein K940chlam9_00275 [Chlamydiae bacterium]|nr:hypothetical protein [Chlamydiota bacterium]
MSCCLSCIRNNGASLTDGTDGAGLKIKEHDAKVTAFALGIIALTFAVISFALYGVGAMPPASLYGLGFLVTLGGATFGALSAGVLTGALVMGAAAAVRHHQQQTSCL